MPAPGPIKEPTTAAQFGNGFTSSHRLATNAIWNLFGACLPALVAIFALPILKRDLGTERLGVITLAWAVVGYFGLFDFGVSRALTKVVAQRLGENELEDVPSLIWSSLLLLSGVGLIGALLAFFSASWLINGPLKVPAALRSETLQAFYWLSFSIPVVVVIAGLRGVLEAFQSFRLATAIRIPFGVFAYLGPLLVLPFSHSIAAIIGLLAISRSIAGAVHLWACIRVFPQLRNGFQIQRSGIVSLLRFGGWMTVSNVAGPLMVTCDRFVIGAMLSLSAVAYYAVPMELVSRLSLVPAAIAGVLFPAFSTAHASDPKRLAQLLQSGTRYIFILLLPLSLFLMVFAPEILRLWLGADFARQSTPVVRWLLAAILINGLGYIPFSHIQAAGRPDITAKLHLAELPLYVALLAVLIHRLGIEGAAIAWFARTSMDSTVLFACSRRLLLQSKFATAGGSA